MTFALSTMGLKGTGSGTGDCGVVCALALTASSEKIKSSRPKPSRTESGFIKRKCNRESRPNPLSTCATNRRGPLLQKRQLTPWGFFLLYGLPPESDRLPPHRALHQPRTVKHSQQRCSFSRRARQHQSLSLIHISE